MNPAIFRAKYVVVLVEGRHLPVLLPPAATVEELPTGTLVAAGRCELHELGSVALGFTVEAWPESGLRCREQDDVKVLDLHFFGVEPVRAGQPFTTRPGGVA